MSCMEDAICQCQVLGYPPQAVRAQAHCKRASCCAQSRQCLGSRMGSCACADAHVRLRMYMSRGCSAVVHIVERFTSAEDQYTRMICDEREQTAQMIRQLNERKRGASTDAWYDQDAANAATGSATQDTRGKCGVGRSIWRGVFAHRVLCTSAGRMRVCKVHLRDDTLGRQRVPVRFPRCTCRPGGDLICRPHRYWHIIPSSSGT